MEFRNDSYRKGGLLSATVDSMPRNIASSSGARTCPDWTDGSRTITSIGARARHGLANNLQTSMFQTR